MKIPEYQAEKLASSLVGTPGIDQSGAMIGNAVTKAAGQVEDTAFAIAVKRQKAVDETSAIKKKTEAIVKADALKAQNDALFAESNISPEERAAQTRQGYEEMTKGLLDTATSPGERAILEQEFASLVGTYTIDEARRGRENQAFLAGKNIVDGTNQIAVRAANVGRDRSLSTSQIYMALQGQLAEAEQLFQAGLPSLNPKTAQELHKQIPESIVKSTLSNMLLHRPEDVKAFVDSGQFNNVLDAAEITKLREDAVSAIPKVRDQQKLEQLYAEVGNNQELWDAYANNDPNLLQKLSQTDSKFAKNLRELAIKGAVDPEDKDAAILDLQNRFDAMIDVSKKGKPVRKETQLSDLADFMDKVIEYRKMGLVTDSVANNYRTKFINPLYQKVVSEGKPSGNLGLAEGFLNFTTLGVAGKMADWWFSKNARLDSPTARATVSKAFMDAYDPARFRTEADVRKLAKDVLVGYANTAIPALGLVDGTPNKVQHPDRQQSVVNTGKSDVTGAVALKGTGVETKRVPGPNGKWYRVSFKNGKPVGTPELINE